MMTIDQLATIIEVESLWRQLCNAANVHEIRAERGNKLERLQIERGSERIEIVRIWRGDSNGTNPKNLLR